MALSRFKDVQQNFGGYAREWNDVKVHCNPKRMRYYLVIYGLGRLMVRHVAMTKRCSFANSTPISAYRLRSIFNAQLSVTKIVCGR